MGDSVGLPPLSVPQPITGLDAQPVADPIEPSREPLLEPLIEPIGERTREITGPETGVITRETRDRGAVTPPLTLHASFASSLPPIFDQLASTRDAPTQDQLRELLTGFAGLTDPSSALTMLCEARPPLAEIAALFGPLGGSDLLRDRATALSRCHLAVNTDGGAMVTDAAEAILLASGYAKTLGYQVLLEKDGRLVALREGSEIDLLGLQGKDREAPDALLRQIGRMLNERHFQNATIIPPERVSLAPESGEYRADNAYWCSHFSMLAYAEPGDAIALARAWGFKEVRFIDDPTTDTQAIVASGDKGVFVAFRGTSNFNDFKIDASFSKKPGFGGNVHSGFKRAYDSVSAKLKAELADLGGGRPIFFTGHSLGAALAQLAAKDFVDQGGRAAGVYTYGSPRVGDRSFAASYNEQLGDLTYHHVNHRDAVTGVPPGLFGFADTGFHRFTFDGDGEMTRSAITPPRVRARGLESLEMLESVSMEAMIDPEEAARQHAAAVAAIESEMFGIGPSTGAGLESARGVALEGLFSPVNDHYNKNYLRLTCAELRSALLTGSLSR